MAPASPGMPSRPFATMTTRMPGVVCARPSRSGRASIRGIGAIA